MTNRKTFKSFKGRLDICQLAESKGKTVFNHVDMWGKKFSRQIKNLPGEKSICVALFSHSPASFIKNKLISRRVGSDNDKDERQGAKKKFRWISDFFSGISTRGSLSINSTFYATSFRSCSVPAPWFQLTSSKKVCWTRCQSRHHSLIILRAFALFYKLKVVRLRKKIVCNRVKAPIFRRCLKALKDSDQSKRKLENKWKTFCHSHARQGTRVEITQQSSSLVRVFDWCFVELPWRSRFVYPSMVFLTICNLFFMFTLLPQHFTARHWHRQIKQREAD